MKVIWKEPGKAFEVREVENTLEALQKAVGGYIETFTFAEDACVICDEEGRLKGKPYNCEIWTVDFCGTILIVGVDGEEFTDVPEEAVELFVPTKVVHDDFV